MLLKNKTMNVLISLFLIAYILQNFIFEQKEFLLIYLSLLLLYSLIYSIQKSNSYQTASKKLQSIYYNQSWDPTLYSKDKLDVSKPEKFIKEIEHKLNRNISFPLFFAKVMGEVIKDLPETNNTIKTSTVSI